MNKPNILLVTIDALRADMLSCYGYPSSITPAIDQLARSGIRFDQAITAGTWTQAAFPTLLTSSYASMHGGCLGPLAASRPSPIEFLQRHGYRTAGFSTNPLVSKNYRYHRGFDHFSDLVPRESDPFLRGIRGGERLLRLPLTHTISRLFGFETRPPRLYVSAAELTDQVCDWLQDTHDPFFAWVHYMDIHWPYHREELLSEPAEIAQAWRDLGHMYRSTWRGEQTTASQRDHYLSLYKEALVYLDTEIGRLLEQLQGLANGEDTIILLLADHGEEFLEHGRWGHLETNLYDEIIRIPFIIHLPGSSSGIKVDSPVSTLDVMPTILNLCGFSGPLGMEGVSLVPLLNQEDTELPRETTISEMWRENRHMVALRTNQHKYIWDSINPDRPELYDLTQDPGERKNIVSEEAELSRQFQALVEAHRQKVLQSQGAETPAEPEFDENVLRRLKDLGYVE